MNWAFNCYSLLAAADSVTPKGFYRPASSSSSSEEDSSSSDDDSDDGDEDDAENSLDLRCNDSSFICFRAPPHTTSVSPVPDPSVDEDR